MMELVFILQMFCNFYKDGNEIKPHPQPAPVTQRYQSQRNYSHPTNQQVQHHERIFQSTTLSTQENTLSYTFYPPRHTASPLPLLRKSTSI
jgi:hypothetical protein